MLPPDNRVTNSILSKREVQNKLENDLGASKRQRLEEDLNLDGSMALLFAETEHDMELHQLKAQNLVNQII